MTNKKPQHILAVFFVILTLLGMAACSPETSTQVTPLPGETDIATQSMEETEPSLTSTPTPDLPVVLLIAGENADAWTVDRLQAILGELVADSSLDLVVQEGLSGESLPQNAQIVVGVNIDGDPAGLAASNQGVNFVFIDQPDAVPGTNLSEIGDPTIDQQNQSFMAGYLAAVVSSDYKVAGLIPSDHSLSGVMTDAFVIGVEFFCGACNPLYPPFQNFPQWELLPVESAVDGFQPVVDTFVINGVEVLYVEGHLISPELLTYLADKNIKVVSDRSPDTVRNNWVGTVTTDPGPALIAIWPDLLAGTGGAQLPSAVGLTDTDAGLISEGRLRLFEEMADELEAGLVSPETAP